MSSKIEQFVPRPGQEPDTRSDKEKIKDHIRMRITSIVDADISPIEPISDRPSSIRYAKHLKEMMTKATLFWIHGENQDNIILHSTFMPIVNASDMQTWAFEAMSEFGFDEQNGEEALREEKENGTSLEKIQHQSVTNDRLIFIREREYITETDETFSVRWVAQIPQEPAQQ